MSHYVKTLWGLLSTSTVVLCISFRIGADEVKSPATFAEYKAMMATEYPDFPVESFDEMSRDESTYFLAFRQIDQRKFAPAIQTLTDLLQKYPTNKLGTELLIARARCYAQLEKVDDAYRDLLAAEKALDRLVQALESCRWLQPQALNFLITASRLQVTSSEFVPWVARIGEKFKRVFARSPNFQHNAHSLLATLYRRHNEPDAAINESLAALWWFEMWMHSDEYKNGKEVRRQDERLLVEWKTNLAKQLNETKRSREADFLMPPPEPQVQNVKSDSDAAASEGAAPKHIGPSN